MTDFPDPRMQLDGAILPHFKLHSTHIVKLPNAAEPERVPIQYTLLTDDGRLVFVSTPYKNLAKTA